MSRVLDEEYRVRSSQLQRQVVFRDMSKVIVLIVSAFTILSQASTALADSGRLQTLAIDREFEASEYRETVKQLGCKDIFVANRIEKVTPSEFGSYQDKVSGQYNIKPSNPQYQDWLFHIAFYRTILISECPDSSFAIALGNGSFYQSGIDPSNRIGVSSTTFKVVATGIVDGPSSSKLTELDGSNLFQGTLGGSGDKVAIFVSISRDNYRWWGNRYVDGKFQRMWDGVDATRIVGP